MGTEIGMGSGRVASSASAQTCHLCDGKTLLFKSKEDGTRPETTNSAGDNRKNVFEGATFALLGDCRFRKLPLARYFCYRKLLISRGAKLDGGPLAIKNSDKVGFLGHKFCNAKVFSQPKCPFLRQFSGNWALLRILYLGHNGSRSSAVDRFLLRSKRQGGRRSE